MKSAFKKNDLFTHNNGNCLVSYRVKRVHKDGTVTAESRFFVTDGQERTGYLGKVYRFCPRLVPVVLHSHL